MSPLMRLALDWLSRNSGWQTAAEISARLGAQRVGATMNPLVWMGYVDKLESGSGEAVSYRITQAGRAAL